MAETIFMIHGMWVGPWCWNNYRLFLQAHGHHCITPLLRHHDIAPACTPPELGTTSLSDYSEDLEQEIRGLPETPVIIGHSMGGLLAQILASRGLARALILLAPAAPAGIWGIRPSVIKCFWKLQTSWGFWKKPMIPSFKAARYAALGRLPVTEQKAIYNRFVAESGRAAAEIGYWFLDPDRAARVDQETVTCPVLVIGGGKDRITPPVIVGKVASRYSRVAEYREFKDNGHWLVGEPGWSGIAEYVANWIEKLNHQPFINPLRFSSDRAGPSDSVPITTRGSGDASACRGRSLSWRSWRPLRE